ncbi:MAG TPA: EAL domain-containing protein [Frankiaceae bacterium]|nr:EAL domain-containing protein [Frankiaceae bacterium]
MARSVVDLTSRPDLTGDLRRALEEDVLELMYQPEVELASGAVAGMEALLRWPHPGRGLLGPADFLSAAERAGLMPALGNWVLERSAAELSRWRDMPPHPTVRARQLWNNVAAAQVTDDFVEHIAEVIRRYELQPGTLGLEFSERTLTAIGPRVLEVLTELRRLGCALAVDDFGTWYSSLATLDELPIDAVKLDRRFVRGVGGDLDDDSIVASVIRLAHARDLYVVAEGVESWSEGARLCELGCDRAHGYLFSPPQRAERARWMLAKGVGWRNRGASSASLASVVQAQRGQG